MQAPHTTRRLTREMLSAATAIRKVRTRLSQLVERDHRAIVGQRDTTVILRDGQSVIAALDALAQRYDIADD